jgi:hypothetical protein
MSVTRALSAALAWGYDGTNRDSDLIGRSADQYQRLAIRFRLLQSQATYTVRTRTVAQMGHRLRSLAHWTVRFCNGMSRWGARSMSQGLRVLVLHLPP